MSRRSERVVITGASSGIGFDAARAFLAEGARVLINARDAARLERARQALGHGDRVVAVAGDIGEAETATRLADAARRELDGVDVLVNNAGIYAAKPFLESSATDLDAFYTTNLKGTFLVTQAIVPLLIDGGGGAIVNIGSVLVDQPSKRAPSAAAMCSKGGVHALTRSLAIELAAHRIRVNAVAPGIIRTPLIRGGADSLADWQPLGRIGEVSETSSAILYLARASFVTGTVLEVDGGYAHGR